MRLEPTLQSQLTVCLRELLTRKFENPAREAHRPLEALFGRERAQQLELQGGDFGVRVVHSSVPTLGPLSNKYFRIVIGGGLSGFAWL